MPRVILFVDDTKTHLRMFAKAVKDFRRSSLDESSLKSSYLDSEHLLSSLGTRNDTGDSYSITYGMIGTETVQFITVDRTDTAVALFKHRLTTDNPIDFIFMDRNCPPIDGDEAIRQIRSHVPNNNPTIFYNTTDGPHDVDDTIKALIQGGPSKLSVGGIQQEISDFFAAIRHSPSPFIERRSTLGGHEAFPVAAPSSMLPFGLTPILRPTTPSDDSSPAHPTPLSASASPGRATHTYRPSRSSSHSSDRSPIPLLPQIRTELAESKATMPTRSGTTSASTTFRTPPTPRRTVQPNKVAAKKKGTCCCPWFSRRKNSLDSTSSVETEHK